MFDPWRSAVLLIAGDKSGRWRQWYREAIPEAEHSYESFLKSAKRRSDMSEVRRWRDTGHLDRAIETAGSQDAFDVAIGRMLEETRGWRLAEMRKRRGLTQEQVAERMSVSASRVSQIEAGDLSTQDVLTRYIGALGGTLKLIADFGDEQLKVA